MRSGAMTPSSPLANPWLQAHGTTLAQETLVLATLFLLPSAVAAFRP